MSLQLGAVRELTGNTTQSLQGLEVTDNDVTLHHLLSASTHGNGENDDKRGGNHGETSSDSVDDNFLRVGPVVGGQDDDGADDSGTEEEKSKLGQLTLEGSSNIDTEEATDSIRGSENPGLSPARKTGGTILTTLGFTTARLLTTESDSNLTNFSVETSGKDNTLGTALCDGGGAVSDVETVTRSSVVRESGGSLLTNGQGLASKQGLVCLEVDNLNKADIGRDGVTSLELDQVTGDNLHGGDGLVVTVADSLGSGRTERAQRVHGLGGLELLDETNGNVEGDNGQNDATLDVRLDSEGHSHGENEDL